MSNTDGDIVEESFQINGQICILILDAKEIFEQAKSVLLWHCALENTA